MIDDDFEREFELEDLDFNEPDAMEPPWDPNAPLREIRGNVRYERLKPIEPKEYDDLRFGQWSQEDLDLPLPSPHLSDDDARMMRLIREFQEQLERDTVAHLYLGPRWRPLRELWQVQKVMSSVSCSGCGVEFPITVDGIFDCPICHHVVDVTFTRVRFIPLRAISGNQ